MRHTLFWPFALWALIILCALLAVRAATAEDGAPPEPTPLFNCQTNTNLDGAEDYNGTPLNDCVKGGPGSNEERGNAGRDRLEGGDGSDPLVGGEDGDVLYGGQEGDYLDGSPGNDYIYTGCRGGCDQTGPVAHFNEIHAGSGDDRIGARNNRSDDVIFGEDGFDTCYVDRGDETHSCEDKRIG